MTERLTEKLSAEAQRLAELKSQRAALDEQIKQQEAHMNYYLADY